MKKITLLIASVLLFACASGQIQQKSSVIHYKPVSYEITAAQGLSVPTTIIPSIKKKLQEYIDDDNSWNKNSRKVNLLINITHIDELSKPVAVLTGNIGPYATLAADVVVIDGQNKQIFRINSKYRTNWFVAVAADLNDRLTTQFVAEVFEAIQRPYED